MNTNGVVVNEDGSFNKDMFWYIIDLYFRGHGLVEQQISSYEWFVDKVVDYIEDDCSFVVRKEAELGESKDIERKYEFEDVKIVRPKANTFGTERSYPLYPFEARVRGLTYNFHMKAKRKEIELENGKQVAEKVSSAELKIGDVPAMLKSKVCRLNSLTDKQDLIEKGECIFDQGGYFVVRGSEKVIIAQERMAPNTVLVFKNSEKSDEGYEESINSVAENEIDVRAHKMKMDYYRFREDKEQGGSKTLVPFLKMSKIQGDYVPVILLFVALGCKNDQEIIEKICYDNDSSMINIVINAIQLNHYSTQEEALKWLGNRSKDAKGNMVRTGDDQFIMRQGRDRITSDLLPHVGKDAFQEKARFLGYMTNHFLSVIIGKRNGDDRDHLARKRMSMTGTLMMSLFRLSMRKYMKEARKRITDLIKKKRNDLSGDIVPNLSINTITDDFRKAMSTGNWPQPNGAEPRPGVSQILNRLTYTSSLAYLRKISSPIHGKGKSQKPRQLHNTQWGYICPCETPEGKECGLVKMLSIMSQITVSLSTEDVQIIRNELDNDYCETPDVTRFEDMATVTKVFLNGNWVKNTSQPQELLDRLKLFRQGTDRGKIKKVMSMVLDHLHKELRIYTDSGRCSRPLFTVKREDGKCKLNLDKSQIIDVAQMKDKEEAAADIQPKDYRRKWKELLTKGVVEYVDADEEEMTMIAMFQDDFKKNPNIEYTHCEIHPALIMGISGSIIPFPDHNQSPRNVYQCAMGKQAIGIYASNYQLRMDSLGHILFYPQRPMVATKMSEHIKFNQNPAGINSIVAICCYSGYNQEDSLMMNQSSIDRGFFRSLSFKTFVAENPKEGDDVYIFNKNSEKKEDDPKYRNLDVDGIVVPGTKLDPDDYLVSPFIMKDNVIKDCSPIKYKPREPGSVDMVVVTTNQNGGKLVKVKIRIHRIPQIGDKFSSRHGQKGTVGMTYRQEDMPFNIDGISPDIIMNPHAIPSRMTVAQLVECLLGKVGTLTGNLQDGTPFAGEEMSVDNISKKLHDHGYQKRGYEALFSGHTGRKLDTVVFMGPVFYQRLKHLVDEKVHARAGGPIANLTRQPLEGRARHGGLRLGEMERDCMISHGMSGLLRERLFFASDRYSIYVCDNCHMMAINDIRSDSYKCSYCGETTHISKVELPYSCKLLFQELMSMSICPRIYADN